MRPVALVGVARATLALAVRNETAPMMLTSAQDGVREVRVRGVVCQNNDLFG